MADTPEKRFEEVTDEIRGKTDVKVTGNIKRIVIDWEYPVASACKWLINLFKKKKGD